jgi:hypothetical protein
VVFGGGYGILQSANFTYNFFTQTLSVSNFSGSGTNITNLNAGNIMTGTLPLTRGGTGATNQGGACLNILPLSTTGQYLKFDGTNWQGDTIIHYNDADTRDVISVSAGVNMVWNAVTKDLDVDLPITWTTPNLGIHNSSPAYPLDIIGTTYIRDELLIGSPSSTSDGYVEIGKNNGSGGNRKMRLHYNSSFDMTISDAGNSSSSSITSPFRIAYDAPDFTMYLRSDGRVDLNAVPNSINLNARWYNRWNNNRVTTQSHALSMRTNRGINIQYGYSLVLTSSRKIKKDETDLEDNECLNICLGLRPKKYKMIDDRNHGDEFRYGFIAEEVEEVLPSAVQSQDQLIPNIYEEANIINDNTIEITKELVIGVEYTIYNSNEDDNIENEYKINILEVLGNNQYRVDLDLSNMYGGSIFIYGKTDEDVKQLKKDHFLPVLTSSVQELHKIITQQQTQINTLMEILERNGIT